jgi:hypothetical protein
MKRTILKAVLIAVAIAFSFLLAGAGYRIFFDKLGIGTPGTIASDAFVPPRTLLMCSGSR